MTFFFEVDPRFAGWLPGIHKGKAMVRIWWGYFAFGYLRVPFEEFTTTAYGWRTPTR